MLDYPRWTALAFGIPRWVHYQDECIMCHVFPSFGSAIHKPGFADWWDLHIGLRKHSLSAKWDFTARVSFRTSRKRLMHSARSNDTQQLVLDFGSLLLRQISPNYRQSHTINKAKKYRLKNDEVELMDKNERVQRIHAIAYMYESSIRFTTYCSCHRWLAVSLGDGAKYLLFYMVCDLFYLWIWLLIFCYSHGLLVLRRRSDGHRMNLRMTFMRNRLSLVHRNPLEIWLKHWPSVCGIFIEEHSMRNLGNKLSA